VVRPLAYSDRTISSTPVSRRCRFFTICGSNVPARSRGTSICTWPVASVSTVFALVPFRTFPDSVPARPCFSCPRCSVISSFSAVSSTDLVSCFSSPSGPVRDRPCSRARRTSSLAAVSSAVGSGFFLLAVTSSSVAVITAPFPLGPSSPA
jgi:hypothetical protein